MIVLFSQINSFRSIFIKICRYFDILIKSFCGVQGRFFQKGPLAAGGIVIESKCYIFSHYATSDKIYYVNQVEYLGISLKIKPLDFIFFQV